MAFQPSDDAAWLSLLRQHMDEVLTYLFKVREQGFIHHEFTPYVDIYLSAATYVIEVDLPGFSEDDFNVSANGTSVRIEGVKRIEKSASAMSYICLERHFGRFCRTFEIPENCDTDKIVTVYENGVLTIRIAEKQENR